MSQLLTQEMKNRFDDYVCFYDLLCEKSAVLSRALSYPRDLSLMVHRYEAPLWHSQHAAKQIKSETDFGAFAQLAASCADHGWKWCDLFYKVIEGKFGEDFTERFSPENPFNEPCNWQEEIVSAVQIMALAAEDMQGLSRRFMKEWMRYSVEVAAENTNLKSQHGRAVMEIKQLRRKAC